MAMAYSYSPEDMTEQQAANHGVGVVAKQPLGVFVDICIQDLFLPDKSVPSPPSVVGPGQRRFTRAMLKMPHIRTGSIYKMQEILPIMQL
jgi:hypothetical protein